MQRSCTWLLATALALITTAARAEFHLYQIEQIFSNASGTVQYVVMHEFTGSNGENRWRGHALTSTGQVMSQLIFPADLPSASTAHTRVLIATQGFADLGILTPDYVMPNGFLPIGGRHPQLRWRRPDNLRAAADRRPDRRQSLRRDDPQCCDEFPWRVRLGDARGGGGRPQSARADRFLVRSRDRRPGNRSRGVCQSVVGNGFDLRELVHLRYRQRWRRPPTLVHGPGPGGDRTTQRRADDLSEHRWQLQCTAGHQCRRRSGPRR